MPVWLRWAGPVLSGAELVRGNRNSSRRSNSKLSFAFGESSPPLAESLPPSPTTPHPQILRPSTISGSAAVSSDPPLVARLGVLAVRGRDCRKIHVHHCRGSNPLSSTQSPPLARPAHHARPAPVGIHTKSPQSPLRK